MPQPTDPPNTQAMLGADGRPTWPWAQWFTQLRQALTSRAFYIPTTTGVPTFVPEARPGYVPMVFREASNTLYIYNETTDAWVGVVLS